MRNFTSFRFVTTVIAGVAIAVAVVSRPLTAPLPDTLELEDMTWVEVQSALQHGYTTVIVPTGGIEQNGPHMVLGKHDYIVRHSAERIAAELGRTLVAPVLPYVPEGSYDPPSGHIRFPGTIGVSEVTYAAVLDGIARSLKAGGFEIICLIADHGGSQSPQAQTAARLNAEWAGQGVHVINVDAYYSDSAQIEMLMAQGVSRADIGEHASIIDTSELMSVHPDGVHLARLYEQPLTVRSTGVIGNPSDASAERGRQLLEIRIRSAVQQIRSRMAAR